MVDKLRRTAPLQITYVDGEQPTGAKLNASHNQFRSALNIVEKAVGDLWNQSGDTYLSNWPLYQTTLARTLGQQRYNSPDLYSLTEDFEFVEKVGVKYEGDTEFYLLFKPASPLVITWTSFGSDVVNGQQKSNPEDVDAAGDWYLDTDTGKVILFSALESNTTVAYEVDPSLWNTGDSVLPSVIPDPGQSTYKYCRVSLDSGVYHLHLPPRRPASFSNKYPILSEQSNNVDASVPGGGTTK